jgi:hypothetical protein
MINGSRRGFAAHLIQVLIITSPAIAPWMTGLFCCGNDACLPQYNKQVTQSVGEIRSLAGVSQRDPFVELIDVTAEHLVAHGG